MENIELTIIMTTYNQEKYVEKAIESAINQKANFTYEVLIGDDCSTDKTKDICLNFAKKHPNKIRLEARNKNIGLIDNYVDLLKKAKGKYIAFLEGDDYWIDDFKIQKQYDFLELNDNYGLVFTNCFFLNEENSVVNEKYEKPLQYNTGEIYNELLDFNFITAITICFKRDLIISRILLDHQYFNKFKTIDYYVILAIARISKIGYIEDVTSVYRVHSNSISNSQNFEKKHAFLKSTFEIKSLFSSKDKGFNFQNKINLKKYHWNLFLISLEYENIGSSKLDININEIDNLFLLIFFRFKIIRRITKLIFNLARKMNSKQIRS
ncbi:MAG: glycosyltransferase [Lutibacter sp.]